MKTIVFFLSEFYCLLNYCFISLSRPKPVNLCNSFKQNQKRDLMVAFAIADYRFIKKLKNIYEKKMFSFTVLLSFKLQFPYLKVKCIKQPILRNWDAGKCHLNRFGR